MSNTKLRLLIIVARHGPREPLTILPKFDSKHWLYQGRYANLTQKGKVSMRLFGEEIKKEYSKHLINLKNTIFESSFVDRTRESAIYFARGFMGNEKFVIKNNNILFPDYVEDYDLESYKTRNPDDTNYKYSVAHYANIIKNKDYLREYGDNLNSTDNEMKKITKTFESSLAKMEDISGFKINSLYNAFGVFSTIKCCEFDDCKIPITATKELIDDLYKFSNLGMKIYYKNDKVKKTYAGELLNKIYDIIELFIKKNTTDEKSEATMDFYYFSTHDTTIMALLYLIINNDSDLAFEIPDFAGNIRFELWEINNKMKLVIKYCPNKDQAYSIKV